jgi:hypothetical protein
MEPSDSSFQRTFGLMLLTPEPVDRSNMNSLGTMDSDPFGDDASLSFREGMELVSEYYKQDSAPLVGTSVLDWTSSE